MAEERNIGELMAERFQTLPKVVQDAITSADVQKHLRDLAEGHKLHVDQWQVLENNVMLTLLGFQPVAELTQHLQRDLSVTEEVAAELAKSISEIVFAPIRAEMERTLNHPTATQAVLSDVETVRAQALDSAAQPETAASAVAPATPPAPAPEQKAERAQVAQTYAGSASHERKTIEGDPYREQIS
jgi:hypothetical protein